MIINKYSEIPNSCLYCSYSEIPNTLRKAVIKRYLTTEMKQKIIIGIACLLVGLIAGWIANGWRMSADSTTEKLSAVQSNADHFRDATKMINEESNQYVRKTYELKKEIDTLQKELADAKKNRPLPVECRPDSERLRVLAEAVTAANTAAGQ